MSGPTEEEAFNPFPVQRGPQKIILGALWLRLLLELLLLTRLRVLPKLALKLVPLLLRPLFNLRMRDPVTNEACSNMESRKPPFVFWSFPVSSSSSKLLLLLVGFRPGLLHLMGEAERAVLRPADGEEDRLLLVESCFVNLPRRKDLCFSSPRRDDPCLPSPAPRELEGARLGSMFRIHVVGAIAGRRGAPS